jgi:two-component system, response regulator PdtaR
MVPWGELEDFVPNVEPSIAGLRCLVLDDEFLIALDIQQILESAGAASVICVGNCDEALAKLRLEAKIDFAVLDIELSGPTRDSVMVAAELVRQNTPFIFVTGMRRKDERMKEFPDAPVVEKPYETPLLLDAVLRALGRR